ncbi:glycosyltransferase [Thalassobium sp. R2A62]|uniref:glycosyltransferase n=1 Tax=Thalassobium sp. R2A62 TaxID=633131 RepID=UPI0001B1D056|nr:glycosyltransferase [Thalassobium sp. R2A62]EET47997.1 glycosyl transferase, group 1 [Thalassobium sp. R2A62]
MRTAIVTGDYYKHQETFINRHIECLFGGNTCVITARYNQENPFAKPVYTRRSQPSLKKLITSPLPLLMNRLKYGTMRIPHGKARSDLKAFLRDQKVELILSEFGTQVLPIRPLAKELGLPIFTYFRGVDASKALRRTATVKAYRSCIPKLDGVIAVSQFLLDNLAEHGIRNDNSHVIPSGVNVRRFMPREKTPKSCVAVGRMVEKKAPLTTIRAFAIVAKHHPEARLTIIGDGPLLSAARALVRDLGIQDRVELPGKGTHDQVRAALENSEVFLQHSVTAKDGNTEGLPTAIQEAMACGCVIVSTRHAGIPEAVFNGKNGFLADERDEVGYTENLNTVLESDSRKEMGHNSRLMAEEHYDNNALLGETEKILQSLVARKKGQIE